MGAATVGMTTYWVDRTGTPWPAAYDPPEVEGPDLPAVARELLAR
jgi:FMN phosphatase YigB (HAD superfamily)